VVSIIRGILIVQLESGTHVINENNRNETKK
jgi:hypothetical protein